MWLRPGISPYSNLREVRSTLLVLSLVPSPGLGTESASPKLCDLGTGKKTLGFSWKTKKDSPVDMGMSAGQAERTGTYCRVDMTNGFHGCHI